VAGEDRQGGRLSRRCGPGRDPGEFRVDDAGGVDPYEHLAFPGMGLRRLLVGERLGATACAQIDRLHIPPPSSCWPNKLIRRCFLRRQAERLSPTLRRHEKHWPVSLCNLCLLRAPASDDSLRRSRRAYKISPILRGSLLGALALAWPAAAQVKPFPGDVRTQKITTDDGATIHLRAGGHGPVVVLLHGFGDTGDMWAPLAAALARDHTVIVPDLRGMGLSAHPDAGYTKKNQALDIIGVMDALNVDRAALVTHDIGNMVGYAVAVQFPTRITRWAVIDAPLPGIGDWDNIVRAPLLWHFNFRGPDVERLVAGRERIYLDRFYNDFS